MIPRKLTLSGFLSYHDPVEIDFTAFSLACISGPNGAGKSSLLDAITWALFGKARQRDDEIIHKADDVQEARVSLEFEYEGNLYRVRRQRSRKKRTTLLEFFIQTPTQGWKALTTANVRTTQALIEETLRVDYDTFIHASFFLQGQADKFSRERPGKRKEVLARILGLQVWETYRERAAQRRRATEQDLHNLDGRMNDMRAEVQYEDEIRQQLEEVEAEIARRNALAAEQERILQERTRAQAVLEQQRKLVEELERQLQALKQNQQSLQERLAAREEEQQTYQSLLARAEEIRAAYQAWQQARAEVARYDALAEQFHELERQRQPHLQTIAAERAALQQALQQAEQQAAEAEAARARLQALAQELADAEAEAQAAEQAIAEAHDAQKRLTELAAQRGQRLSQLAQLEEEGKTRAERSERLRAVEGSECPLCGQPLSPEHRQRILDQWEAEIHDLREQYAALKDDLKALEAEQQAARQVAQSLAERQKRHRQALQNLARLKSEQARIQQILDAWEKEGAPRLATLRQQLETEDFAAEARAALAALDEHLRALGYDPAAHEAARAREADLRDAETALRQLESAQAALQPLQREIEDLKQQHQALQERLSPLEARYREAAEALKQAEAHAPDVAAAEARLTDLRERIAALHKARGGHQQRLHTIAKHKEKLRELEAQRLALARKIGYYKTLEEAFGQKGVPALLIEQALPALAQEANRILDRLTDGRMTVQFQTQAAYRDPKRKDLKETLEIIIRDEKGQRAYESYSGGEAFRVDFAIRVALARLLAHRAGARLQTLVIDEGFGSQDAEGRQRLVEAIRAVQNDFAKIVVITHVEALKEAFPVRLEVEKTPRGSQVQMVFQ